MALAQTHLKRLIAHGPVGATYLGLEPRPGSRPRRRRLSRSWPPSGPHFPARAMRVIFLCMEGGPSHVDTFDPKPELDRQHGKEPPRSVNRRNTKLMKSPFTFQKYGRSGTEVSELYPEVGRRCIDDLCVIRSMHHETPAHERALLLMNSGNVQPIRPDADLRG